jgi:hypothetical protein
MIAASIVAPMAITPRHIRWELIPGERMPMNA